MTTRIVLDAMGGDRAPGETVRGAVEANRELGLEVILVGDQPAIVAELSHYPGGRFTVVNAGTAVGMDEHPSDVLRSKKDCSIAVGLEMVARGEADGFVSAGNSGAIMAFALFKLGRIKGVERPALGLAHPTMQGPSLLLDVGANTDCKPQYLLQFAQMGSVYFRSVFGVASPRVALLSTGAEETKGNQVVQEAHKLLKNSGLNFVGNVEGMDLPMGGVEVVVCDGFTGNVALKLSEGIGEMFVRSLRKELGSTLVSRLAASVLRPSFRRVLKITDYTEYGGVPLLGVNGVCIIAHGRSSSRAIVSALRVAKQAAEQHTIEAIRDACAV